MQRQCTDWFLRCCIHSQCPFAWCHLSGFLCTCNSTFLFPGIREWDSCQEVVLEEWSLFPWAAGVSQLSTCQVSELLWEEWGLLGGTEFRVTSFIYGALTGWVFSINIKDPWSCGTSKSNCDLTCFSIRKSLSMYSLDFWMHCLKIQKTAHFKGTYFSPKQNRQTCLYPWGE